MSQAAERAPAAAAARGGNFWRLAGWLMAAAALLAAAGWWYLHLPAHRFRAALADMRAKDDEGVALHLAALEKRPAYEPHARLLRGYLRLRAGELEQAYGELKHAFDHPQTRVAARVLAGECFYKSRQYGDAARALRDVISIDPNNVDAHRWLAGTYYDIGAARVAERHLLKVSELAPEDGRPEWFLGRIKVLFSQYDEALAHYQESLRRQPDSKNRVQVLAELATVQLKLRLYDECLQTVAQLEPTGEVLAVKAECQYGQAGADEALATLEQALALEPDNLAALSLKGKILLEAGRAAEAAEVFARAVEKHPADYLAHFKLAEAYRKLGQAERASAAAATAQDIRAGLKRLHELQIAASQRPLDPDVRFELGELLTKKLRDAEAGKRWYERALGLDPDHQQARQALGM